MSVYFRNSVFFLLFCLIIFSIGIKATETISREAEALLPKLHSSIQAKQERPTESQATIKFRKNIDRVAKDFENFENRPSQEQQNLFVKWQKTKIDDWVAQACFARHYMLDGRLVVSDETWKKLNEVQALYPKEKKKYYLFF